ncbi:unnamed protein product, partial [Protopolystoma xenopodis]
MSRNAAVECIQRNAEAWLELIQWPWWQVFLTLRQIARAARSQTEAAAGDRSSAALGQPVSRPALEASS